MIPGEQLSFRGSHGWRGLRDSQTFAEPLEKNRFAGSADELIVMPDNLVGGELVAANTAKDAHRRGILGSRADFRRRRRSGWRRFRGVYLRIGVPIGHAFVPDESIGLDLAGEAPAFELGVIDRTGLLA